jgi:2,4-dienoyl-CoA reductase-like NADH-dependent reductase (Old Yellow Enzyme family)
VSDVFAPAKLGPLELRNRIIKSATFEGRTPRRVVTDRLIDFHRAVAAGGAAMSTVAYCAVAPDGGTDGRQIVMTDEAVAGLRELTDAIHSEGAAASAQVGHAGPVANPLGTKQPVLSPSRTFSPFGLRWSKAASSSDIGRVIEDFERSGRVAREGGFDCVEVHLGHNYLPSAFLSPRMNRRDDDYGGSLVKRARFAREVVRATRRGAGPSLAVTAKLNMTDGVRRGFDVDESLEVASMLQSDGTLDALVLTGGSSFYNPMFLFRGDAPVQEMADTMPGLLKTGFKLVGRRFMKSYPFEEAYFLPLARRFREALEMPVVLLGGINRMETIEDAVDEGFAFVAMARALLREPDLPNRMRLGAATEATCIHCNKCMPTIYAGTHCPVPGL